MLREGRRPPRNIGQGGRPRSSTNTFWDIVYTLAVAAALLAILGLSIWIISEVLKLKNTSDKTKKKLKDPCPDPCFDPCPNVTLVCPDPSPVASLEESELCDDWNQCTIDLLGSFGANDGLGCKNLNRPNGFPCESPCFVAPSNGTANTSCHKGVCTDETCLGTCEEGCPVLNGTFDSIECVEGSCIYGKVLIEGEFGELNCEADIFQSSCEALIEDEPLRQCLVADVVCGDIAMRKKKKKRQGAFFVLCIYSFFCAPPRGLPNTE